MDQKLELNQLVSETLLPGLTFTDWMCRTPTPAVSHKPCVSGQTSPHFTGEALSHLPTAHCPLGERRAAISIAGTVGHEGSRLSAVENGFPVQTCLPGILPEPENPRDGFTKNIPPRVHHWQVLRQAGEQCARGKLSYNGVLQTQTRCTEHRTSHTTSPLRKHRTEPPHADAVPGTLMLGP